MSSVSAAVAALSATQLVSRCTQCSGSRHHARSMGRHRLAVVVLQTRRSTRCAAELDVSIGVKIGLAESSGQLDLSEKGLETIPESVFELNGLEVLSLFHLSFRRLQATVKNSSRSNGKSLV